MGMMEHIAFQSFWQRGKTFAHSKGTEIPSLPSVFTVDPYCPCSFDWCGLLKVHGRMRPSVTWCTKRGFCLPSSWSWAELQQPVASREEQSVVERWSYDEIPTFCNIPKASQKHQKLCWRAGTCDKSWSCSNGFQVTILLAALTTVECTSSGRAVELLTLDTSWHQFLNFSSCTRCTQCKQLPAKLPHAGRKEKSLTVTTVMLERLGRAWCWTRLHAARLAPYWVHQNLDLYLSTKLRI